MAKKKPQRRKREIDPEEEKAPQSPLCPVVSATHELVHRSQIKEAPYNPRGMNDDEKRLLAHSLEKFGLVNYLVWNKRTGNLVGGHQRLAELDRKMGTLDYRMWVNVVDLNERDEKNLNVMLNNPDAQGAFDLAKLGAMFQNKEIDPEHTGFTPAQMYQFFGESPMMEQPEQLAINAEQMREARERLNKIKESAGKRDDPEYYLVVFDGAETRDAFLEAAGLPLEKGRWVNGSSLADRFAKLRENAGAA